MAPIDRLGQLLDTVERVLVTVPASVDTDGPRPGNVTYVGPVFEPAGGDEGWTPPSGDGPLIVVSLGTTDMDEVPVLTNVLDALAHERARVFATVGDHADPGAIPTPANATVGRFVQHAAVLPHADLVISHGGIGTALAAVAHGLPVLFLPLGRDQPANAKAIAATGAARVLPPSATPGQIARAAEELLTDPSYREAARAGGGGGPGPRRGAPGDGRHRRAGPTGPDVIAGVRTGDLDALIAHHVDDLGYRLVMITPADSPRSAVVVAPDGTPRRLEREPADDRILPGRAAGRHRDHAGTRRRRRPAGRAGMRYRDLLPSRLGGRCIASHIVIPDGGPVPDYVHHHRVGVQLIACVAGWVRVVYEDQGPPFVLRAGDAVLQPPGIRHRVLEASPGLEVVELSCPAEHETFVEHELALPTRSAGTRSGLRRSALRPPRRRGDGVGRRPVPTVSSDGTPPSPRPPTDGRRCVGLRPGRADEAPVAIGGRDDGTGRYRAWFVTAGSVTVSAGGRPPVELARRGTLVAPLSAPIVLTGWSSSEAELLEIVFAPD